MVNFRIVDLEKHSDERGWLVEFLRKEHLENKEFGQITISHTKSKAVRGNHYHRKKREWFFLAKGKAKVVLKSVETNEEKEIFLDENDAKVLIIEPLTAHAFQNVGNSDMVLVEYSTDAYDRENPDVVKFEILK